MVRLRLLTNQTPLKKKVKDDKGKEQEVDDVERMLRLEKEFEIAADASTAMIAIVVPKDLPPHLWDVVLVGELLSPDKKQVLATGYASLSQLDMTAAP